MSTLQIPTARVFRPLLEPARYKGAYGGRGSGKSHFFAGSVVEYCLMRPGARIVCVREVQRSLKESVKRLVEDKIAEFGVGHKFEIRHDQTITPGGGVILYQGLADHTAESIKSLEGFNVAYAEEAQTLTARSLEFLRPTIRAPKSELWFSWNPRHASDPVDQLLRGDEPPTNATVVKANYCDNPFFPPELEEERQFDYRDKPDRYPHIWLGEYEPTAIGAIWSREVIARNRRKEAPDMKRILVAVDPAVSSDENADHHGIIVLGTGMDGRGYVLSDFSMKGTPREWADKAGAAYDLYDADAIVCETNQGGEMVKSTMRAAKPDARVIEVRATRGKHVRAEPISALYAMDRISHVGAFPDLENEMCLMTAEGYQGEGSPDRCDAMVWGFTELFPNMTRKQKQPDHASKQRQAVRSWMS